MKYTPTYILAGKLVANSSAGGDIRFNPLAVNPIQYFSVIFLVKDYREIVKLFE